MAGLPITIPLPSESAVASYQWQDIASGEGFVSFYLMTSATSAATIYLLNTKDFYSKDIGTSSTSNIDLTFSSSIFKRPAIISGTATLNLGAGIHKHNTAGGSAYTYFTITLSLVSGGVTSVLHTGNTNTIENSGARVILYPMAISTRNIKRGDYITLRIVSVISGSYPLVSIGHDPKNRALTTYIVPSTDANAFTSSILNIPFKIDL